MEEFWTYLYVLTGALVIAVINVRVFVSFQKSKRKILEHEQMTREKLYEIAILKELEERIGYSLNLEKVFDIVLGSLRQFVSYSVASYMLVEGPRVLFKSDINSSVTRPFLEEMRKRMLVYLNEKAQMAVSEEKVVEELSGAILVDELDTPFSSYFELPLKLKGKVIGVLAVGSVKSGIYKPEVIHTMEKMVFQTELAVGKFAQALELEKGKISSMVESMVDGVIMTDRESHIVVANPASKMIIGQAAQSSVSIFDFIEFMGGSFDIRGRLEESIALKKVVMIDELLINQRFYKIFVAPVKNILNEDEILGGVVIFHDITHEKEVERLREDFTSMMVHDLRAPLDGIRKMVGLLQENAAKDLMEKYLGMVFKEATAMLDLVNGLLDIAKLESGTFEVFLEEADLKKLIAEKIDYYNPVAQQRSITLKANVAANVPEKVVFDEVRIARVINNLLGNALKFTEPNGEVRIDAFLHKKGENIFGEAKAAGVSWFVDMHDEKILSLEDCIVVAVTDSGQGIPKGDEKIIFEKFHQSSQKREGEKKGTGLGLSIARGIAEAHGGRLEVASHYGEGTTFWFTLPKREKLLSE